MTGLSVGVDIEEVRRFHSLVRNRRFLSRIFTAQERSYCLSKKNKSQHFAVRFAAKEAVWKALSEVIQDLDKSVAHREVGITNTVTGKPEVVLPKVLSRWKSRISISLSHTDSYAVAVAVVRK